MAEQSSPSFSAGALGVVGEAIGFAIDEVTPDRM
jgi:hypothetical protein